MGMILASIFKGVAEGQYGEWLKRAYWAAAGKKTLTSVILAGSATALWLMPASECAACATWAERIAWVAGPLAAIGLFDGAVRIEPPKR